MLFEKTYTHAQISDIGSALAHFLKPGDVVTFTGSLGAGKTTLVKAILRGLYDRAGRTWDESVGASPTFTFCVDYLTLCPTHHMDWYRLKTVSELVELDLLQKFCNNSIVFVEWFEKFSQTYTGDRIEIMLNTSQLSSDDAIDTRVMRVDGKGERVAVLQAYLRNKL